MSGLSIKLIDQYQIGVKLIATGKTSQSLSGQLTVAQNITKLVSDLLPFTNGQQVLPNIMIIQCRLL